MKHLIRRFLLLFLFFVKFKAYAALNTILVTHLLFLWRLGRGASLRFASFEHLLASLGASSIKVAHIRILLLKLAIHCNGLIVCTDRFLTKLNFALESFITSLLVHIHFILSFERHWRLVALGSRRCCLSFTVHVALRDFNKAGFRLRSLTWKHHLSID